LRRQGGALRPAVSPHGLPRLARAHVAPRARRRRQRQRGGGVVHGAWRRGPGGWPATPPPWAARGGGRRAWSARGSRDGCVRWPLHAARRASAAEPSGAGRRGPRGDGGRSQRGRRAGCEGQRHRAPDADALPGGGGGPGQRGSRAGPEGQHYRAAVAAELPAGALPG